MISCQKFFWSWVSKKLLKMLNMFINLITLTIVQDINILFLLSFSFFKHGKTFFLDFIKEGNMFCILTFLFTFFSFFNKILRESVLFLVTYNYSYQ